MDDLWRYLPSLLVGAALTVQLAVLSLALALVLGMGTALLRLYGPFPLGHAAWLYTTVIRGVPDLVLILLVFYGGQLLINELTDALRYDGYLELDSFTAGVATLGVIFGAYMAETLRGALLGVHRGQLEAARAIGLTPAQTFWRITTPQMLRLALPGLSNNWLVLLKTTALVSVIGLEDLVRKASLAAGATRQPFTFYLAVAVGYLLLTSVSLLLVHWLQHRVNRGNARPQERR